MADEESIAGGVVHDLPADVQSALLQDDAALSAWRTLTRPIHPQ
jgi:hypothetical protein